MRKIEDALWVLKDKVVGILGLAFKPDTDDIRNAPAIDIIKMLLHEGAKIKAYDPKAMPKTRKILKGVTFCKNAYEVARNADALAIITEWDEFRKLNLRKLRETMLQPIIIDGRNIFDPGKMERAGFIYKSIGR